MQSEQNTKSNAASDSPSDGIVDQDEGTSTSKRRAQQRSIETRDLILRAALLEFAERGFEAGSIRNIALRTGLQHPLITYHFRTKDILWRAVAESAFAEIRHLWDEGLPSEDDPMRPIERLRNAYLASFRFKVAHPDFHHFMLHESQSGNPRIQWLVETILRPMLDRLLPHICEAQACGELPKGDPVLIHYMLVGMTSVLTSLRGEISLTAGVDVMAPDITNAYADIIDQFLFMLHPGEVCDKS